MREIALDTQAATTVAIIDDGCVIGRAQNDSGRHHAESITPLVREALAAAGLPAQLADAGIDRVLVGTGPAPFTGLRAGLVSARVLASVVGVPAYGVSALDVIARQGLDLLPPDTAANSTGAPTWPPGPTTSLSRGASKSATSARS